MSSSTVSGVDPGLTDGRGPERGAVVALVAANGPQWIDGYRALLGAGAVPLLLGADTPAPERARWLGRARGEWELSGDDHGDLRLTRHPAPPAIPLPTREYSHTLLCTSGTTGAPKIVARTLDSLAAEGRRLAQWTGLTPDDVVVLPLPMWHAYALGWVHATFEVGCALVATAPTALGRTLRSIEEGATVVPLTPGVASLLAGRAKGRIGPHRLRMAMVGAGPVTAELERRFADAFGIGLARNYGSTETGALFSGPAGGPDGCVGYPLPGVDATVNDPDGRELGVGETGELRIRLDDAADWHRTGDLATWTPDGLRIVGRNSRAIRRGDRFIAPEEIESVLLAHPGVVDARCVVARGAGAAVALEAEVVGVSADATDLAAIGEHLGAQLAAHKIPDRLRLVGDVQHGPSGKPVGPRTYALADPARLVEQAQAYRRSELVFTLLRLGLLELLGRQPTDASTAAVQLGLDPHVCDLLLRTAQELGLVCVDGHPQPDLDQARPLLELEAALSRGWVTRESLAEVGTRGLAGRAFDARPVDAGFAHTYQRAMHSPAAHQRVRVGLGLARFRPGETLLEITCGPGRYAIGAGDAAALLRTGPLSAGTPGAPRREPGVSEQFDVVVVCNATHLPGPGSDLSALKARLRVGGRLLIDDVFLPGPGAGGGGRAGDGGGAGPAIRLDWLTHGGLNWPTVEGLTAGLLRAGLLPGRTVRIGSPAATLLLATAAGHDDDVRSGDDQ